MRPIAIIDHFGGLDFRIVTGWLADRNHAVYVQAGRLFLVRVDRVQDTLYVEDRRTAVITLASSLRQTDGESKAAQIVERLQGMTAWTFLTQEALNFNGQQYEFHMI